MYSDLASSSFYDLLELAPDATPQEVRAAYLRAKAAYKKDSVALYTLISESETETLLRRIEEAYHVLSNPERRREYDRNHGHLNAGDEQAMGRVRPPRHGGGKVVSIDRVPPMDASAADADLLVPPSTDFTSPSRVPGASPFDDEPVRAPRHVEPEHYPEPAPAVARVAGGGGTAAMGAAALPASPAYDPAPVQIPTKPATPLRATGPEVASDDSIAREIAQETEWKGIFLRKVREARRISIEELSDYTKITKTYILAIEEENFARLPAPVYLRGFVSQIARFLKLPAEKVSAAYMLRHAAAASLAKPGRR